MNIDIDKSKKERSCGNCKWHINDGECRNPDYPKFIMKACRTGYCKGFTPKTEEAEN